VVPTGRDHGNGLSRQGRSVANPGRERKFPARDLDRAAHGAALYTLVDTGDPNRSLRRTSSGVAAIDIEISSAAQAKP